MRALRFKQIKVNGTQCGSPALRHNRLCYFHHRHHEEQIALNYAFDLPVLEKEKIAFLLTPERGGL